MFTTYRLESHLQFDVSDLLTGPLAVVSDLIQKFTTYMLKSHGSLMFQIC